VAMLQDTEPVFTDLI